MNEVRTTPGTPAITREAREFDTLETLAEGIRRAASLDEQVRAAERAKANQPEIQPKETPIVTAEDIRREKKDEEREIY